MVEIRRTGAALALGVDDVEAELARALDSVARAALRRLQGACAELAGGVRPAAFAQPQRRRAVLRATRSDLAKMLDTASKKKNDARLASGIDPVLSAAQRVLEEDSALKPSTEEGAPDEAVTAPAPAVAARIAAPAAEASTDPLAELLLALDAVRDARSGMSFVPAIVRRLSGAMPLPRALELLMQAARRELIELRPEGGLGRLSDEELALCPPGPAGTRLSWARRGAGEAA
jgi:hypothetical protein